MKKEIIIKKEYIKDAIIYFIFSFIIVFILEFTHKPSGYALCDCCRDSIFNDCVYYINGKEPSNLFENLLLTAKIVFYDYFLIIILMIIIYLITFLKNKFSIKIK